jgi:hypothetical protein
VKKKFKGDIKLNDNGDIVLEDGIKKLKKDIEKLLKSPKGDPIRTPIKDGIDFISLDLEIKDGEVNVVEDNDMENTKKEQEKQEDRKIINIDKFQEMKEKKEKKKIYDKIIEKTKRITW